MPSKKPNGQKKDPIQEIRDALKGCGAMLVEHRPAVDEDGGTVVIFCQKYNTNLQGEIVVRPGQRIEQGVVRKALKR